jgi:putative solute:sodium symporter small subunit
MARTRVKRKKNERTDWLPIIALIWVAVGFFVAYIGAETLMSARVHPLHWLVAFAGGVAGYLIGTVWYWRRGDIV